MKSSAWCWTTKITLSLLSTPHHSDANRSNRRMSISVIRKWAKMIEIMSRIIWHRLTVIWLIVQNPEMWFLFLFVSVLCKTKSDYLKKAQNISSQVWRRTYDVVGLFIFLKNAIEYFYKISEQSLSMLSGLKFNSALADLVFFCKYGSSIDFCTYP